MTENYEKLFHEATAKEGEVWHEVVEHRSGYYRCSCGEVFAYGSDIDNHINQINPTYSHADEILKRMKEYCGEERYFDFMVRLGSDVIEKTNPTPIGLINNFLNDYILNPPALLKKAVEFLEKKGE